MLRVTAKWIFITLAMGALPAPSFAQSEEDIVIEEADPNAPETPRPETVEKRKLKPETVEELQNLETSLETSVKRTKEEKEERERIDKIRNNMFNPISPPSLSDIHETLSADIIGISESVDTFFVNERIIEGRNKTNVRILDTFTSIEREGVDNNVDFRLRFRLPRLEQKIAVEVNNLDNNTDADTTSVKGTQVRNPNQRQDTTAGLSLFKDVLGIQSKFTLGFIFRDFAPFGNFRISKNFKFTEKDSLLIISDVFGDTEERYGHRGTMYLDHSFNAKWLFRIFNDSLYRHEFHTFESNHGMTLYQIVNKRSSLAYTASLSSHNPQDQHAYFVHSYDLYPTYRYRIYKQHAFFDVIPRLSFPKKYDFETNWSITLRLEIIFGSV